MISSTFVRSVCRNFRPSKCRPVAYNLVQRSFRPLRFTQFRSFSSEVEESDAFNAEEYEDDDDEETEDRTQIGALAPKFSCTGVFNGEVSVFESEMFRGRWLVLFFYPLNFTFVCPTEILEFSEKTKEFSAIDCDLLGASVDSQYSHLQVMKIPRKEGGLGGPMKFPILADLGGEVADSFNALNVAGTHSVRATYIIDPEGKLRHMSFNDPPVGRNVDELLRLVKGYQYADEHGEVCPVGWQPGDATIKPDFEEKLEYFETKDK
uniref:thioredoxin-dependent peroxiredoxin n=1 Tax=Hirondellea gigas TaxID=1518452 RepID=A0A2P2I7M3_9CRUS